jgi:hypothetical protein
VVLKMSSALVLFSRVGSTAASRLRLGAPGVQDRFGEMWRHDRSASRGEMAARALVVFEHASKLGNVSPEELYRLVTIERRGRETARPALSIDDYRVSIAEKALDGVRTIAKLVPREPLASRETQVGSRAA